jgi:predicted transcriptional regulator
MPLAVSGQRLRSSPAQHEPKERVRRLAAAHDRGPLWIMRDAEEQCLEREEEHESVHQDALTSWTHYRYTGLYATAEGADAWLAKLESGEDADAPHCHV